MPGQKRYQKQQKSKGFTMADRGRYLRQDGEHPNAVANGYQFIGVGRADLTYTGNLLTKVVDGSADATLQHHVTGTTNYTYDVNGNMKTQLNTAQPGNNITTISYNHMSLPASITASGGISTYAYDATGRKLRSTQASVTTDYIDGIEWVDNTLNLLHMEEGRITKSGSPNPAQQKPYVKQTQSGKPVDVNGKQVDPKSKEAYVPKEDFRFKKQ